MDSDQGKLFIGGISWDTNEDKLRDYFGNYGDVSHASVMRDKNTGKPRGFAFVVFSDPSVLDRVLEDNHVIDGRTVMGLLISLQQCFLSLFFILPFVFHNPVCYVLGFFFYEIIYGFCFVE